MDQLQKLDQEQSCVVLAKWAPLLSGSGITSVSASPGLCPLDSGTKILSFQAFNILFCRTLRVHCTCPSKSTSAMPLPFSALLGAQMKLRVVPNNPQLYKSLEDLHPVVYFLHTKSSYNCHAIWCLERWRGDFFLTFSMFNIFSNAFLIYALIVIPVSCAAFAILLWISGVSRTLSVPL